MGGSSISPGLAISPAFGRGEHRIALSSGGISPADSHQVRLPTAGKEASLHLPWFPCAASGWTLKVLQLIKSIKADLHLTQAEIANSNIASLVAT